MKLQLSDWVIIVPTIAMAAVIFVACFVGIIHLFMSFDNQNSDMGKWNKDALAKACLEIHREHNIIPDACKEYMGD